MHTYTDTHIYIHMCVHIQDLYVYLHVSFTQPGIRSAKQPSRQFLFPGLLELYQRLKVILPLQTGLHNPPLFSQGQHVLRW